MINFRHVRERSIWGRSSNGRALASHARGKGIDAPRLQSFYLFLPPVLPFLCCLFVAQLRRFSLSSFTSPPICALSFLKRKANHKTKEGENRAPSLSASYSLFPPPPPRESPPPPMLSFVFSCKRSDWSAFCAASDKSVIHFFPW